MGDGLVGNEIVGNLPKKTVGIIQIYNRKIVRHLLEIIKGRGCHLSPRHHHAQNRWGSSVVARAVQPTMLGPAVNDGAIDCTTCRGSRSAQNRSSARAHRTGVAGRPRPFSVQDGPPWPLVSYQAEPIAISARPRPWVGVGVVRRLILF
jgi:hypothetical protein